MFFERMTDWAVEANTKGGKEIQLIQKGEATAFTLDFAIHEGPLGIQNKMSPTQTLWNKHYFLCVVYHEAIEKCNLAVVFSPARGSIFFNLNWILESKGFYFLNMFSVTRECWSSFIGLFRLDFAYLSSVELPLPSVRVPVIQDWLENRFLFCCQGNFSEYIRGYWFTEAVSLMQWLPESLHVNWSKGLGIAERW